MPASKLAVSVSRDTADPGVRRDSAIVTHAPTSTDADATRVHRLARMAHQCRNVASALRVTIGAAQLVGESVLFARLRGLS